MGDRDNGMTDDEFEPSGEDSSSGDESQSSSEVSDDVIPVSRRRGRPSQKALESTARTREGPGAVAVTVPTSSSALAPPKAHLHLSTDAGRMRVGDNFQVKIPSEGESLFDPETIIQESMLLWKPVENLDTEKLKEYLAFAETEESRMPLGHAMAVLFYNNLDYTAAYDDLRSATLCPDVWTEADCQAFELGLASCNKKFGLIQQKYLPHKSIRSLVTHYYIWKSARRIDLHVEAHSGRASAPIMSVPVVRPPPAAQVAAIAAAAERRRSSQMLGAIEKKVCSNCLVDHSPLWRLGLNNSVLCNACGLHYQRNGHHRHVSEEKLDQNRRSHDQNSPGVSSVPARLPLNPTLPQRISITEDPKPQRTSPKEKKDDANHTLLRENELFAFVGQDRYNEFCAAHVALENRMNAITSGADEYLKRLVEQNKVIGMLKKTSETNLALLNGQIDVKRRGRPPAFVTQMRAQETQSTAQPTTVPPQTQTQAQPQTQPQPQGNSVPQAMDIRADDPAVATVYATAGSDSSGEDEDLGGGTL